MIISKISLSYLIGFQSLMDSEFFFLIKTLRKRYQQQQAVTNLLQKMNKTHTHTHTLEGNQMRYLKGFSYLVIEFLSPDASSSFPGPTRVSSLNHEPFDISMKYSTIVVATST